MRKTKQREKEDIKHNVITRYRFAIKHALPDLC